MLYPAKWKKTTVDQNKVIKKSTVPYFWATRYTNNTISFIYKYKFVAYFTFHKGIASMNYIYIPYLMDCFLYILCTNLFIYLFIKDFFQQGGSV